MTHQTDAIVTERMLGNKYLADSLRRKPRAKLGPEYRGAEILTILSDEELIAEYLLHREVKA